MKKIGYILLLLSGATGLLAITVIQKEIAPSLGTYIGAFAFPAIFAWWGIILVNKTSNSGGDATEPTPETHVRCPDCRELVRIDAKLCKHCKAKLIPGRMD